MTDKFIVNVVGNYVENEWTNPRTGERKLIKSISLVLQNGKNVIVGEASDDMAVTLRGMSIQPNTHVLASLSFSAARNEKDGVVRYFQRINIERLVVL